MREDQNELLEQVRLSADGMRSVEVEHNAAMKRAMQEVSEARLQARRRRAEAIRAADDAGVPREAIAAAAGLQWPMSRQRWSVLRKG